MGIIQDFSLAKEENSFYLIDEIGAVKIVTLELPTHEDGGRPKLKIQENYYVSKDFVGGLNFTIANNMLYDGFKSYPLHERGTVSEDFDSGFQIATLSGVFSYNIPLISENTIVIVGVIDPK